MTDTPPEDHPKVSHWDRPKPPHDWRWVVGGVGRTLITLGLLMFGFVAYQLWGTGIQTAQAQRELSADFDKLVGGTGTTTTTVGVSVSSTTTSTVPATTTPAGTIAPTTTTTTSLPGPAAGKPLPAEGEAIARLEIPRIGLNRIVVEGATTDDLAKGPGHFPETPLPGQLGNAAIAGHRTTHLHPFYDIDKLQPGDEIIVTTLNGRYVYRVTGTEVVSPDDYADVIPTTDATKATLTLVSCTPRYSSSHRIIVRSDLVAGESDPLTASAAIAAAGQNLPAETLPSEGAVTTVAAVTTVTTVDTVSATVSATDPSVTTVPTSTTVPVTAGATGSGKPSPDAFANGWFSDTSAIPQTLLWGVLGAAIAYGILSLSRKVRRYWVGIVAGFVPFIVVLYFFYENINRLLPPNL
ncbi:MAG: class E sortase [Ilumatobacteraceae bacterium]